MKIQISSPHPGHKKLFIFLMSQNYFYRAKPNSEIHKNFSAKMYELKWPL